MLKMILYSLCIFRSKIERNSIFERNSLLGYQLSWILFYFQFIMVLNREVVLVDFPADIPVNDRENVILGAMKLLIEATPVLQNAMKNQYFKVYFLVPNDWKLFEAMEIKQLGKIEFADSRQQFDFPHITIVTSSAFKNPVSIQYRGCGYKGRKIILTTNFLLSTDITDKEKIFAREWIKFQYGVFDESGFPNDTKFPDYYKSVGANEMTYSGCSDVPLKFKPSTSKPCFMPLDEKTGFPVSYQSCPVEVIPESGAKARSSILNRNIYKLPNVTSICDKDHPHDKHSLNKHNLFCKSQSIYEVLKKHEDFQSKLKGGRPSFKILWKQNKRVMVVIDNTVGMKHNEYLIKSAIITLIYLLPDGSEFGFIPFDFVQGFEELQTLNEDSRKTMVEKIINLKFVTTETSPKQAIDKATDKALYDFTRKKRAASMFIIASVAPSSDLEYTTNRDIKDLCAIVITFDKKIEKKFMEILNLETFTSCKRYINIDSIGFSAFITIIRTFNENMRYESMSVEPHVLVNGHRFSDDYPLSFYISKRVEYFDVLLAYHEKKTIDGTKIRFHEGNKTLISLDLNRVDLSLEGLTRLRVQNDKKNVNWTVKTESKDPVLAIVVVKLKNASDIGPNIKVWYEYEKKSEDEFQNPVILYAEVLYGTYPMLLANVVANITSPSEESELIQLYDNGFGDPDVTQYDGIYSRYFVNFTSLGRYNVEIRADDNKYWTEFGEESSFDQCCGSQIDYKKSRNVGKYNISGITSFEVLKPKPKHGYEPGRIYNLMVLEEGDYEYTFRWTSSGNEKDYGSVEEYTLRIFSTIEDAYTFDIKKQIKEYIFSVEPNPYGASQETNVNLKNVLELEKPFFFAIQSKNNKGLLSEPSNVVRIFFTKSTNQKEGVDPSEHRRTEIVEKSSLPIIIISVILVILLLVIGFFTFFFRHKILAIFKEKKEVEVITSSESTGEV